MADAGNSETNIPVGDWTTGTLKIYHDDRINAVEKVAAAEFNRVDSDISKLKILLDERSISQDKALQAALGAAKEAVSKSEEATERRFESVNEFRGQLSDQVHTFLPRTEYNARHETLENRVSEITDRMNRNEGAKQGSDVTIGKIYAAIGVVGTILGILVLLSNGVF